MRISFFKTIHAVRGPLAVLLATGLLFAWLVSGPASAEMLFQSSNLAPTETPTATPTAQATFTPTPEVTPTVVQPTEPATLSPTPTETIESTETLTATLPLTTTPELTPRSGEAAELTPTPTVDLAGMLLPLAIPTLRPVSVPSPTPAPDRLLLAATLIDRAVASLAWLWLICGSFLFFVVAGIVAGLGITGRVANRRSQPLYGGDATDSAFHPYLDTPPTNPGREPYTPQNDDNWPASLP